MDCLSVLAFNVVVHTQMNAPEIFQVLTVLFTVLLFTDKYTDFSGDYFFKRKEKIKGVIPHDQNGLKNNVRQMSKYR